MLGFPCNQFGSQESGTEEEIGEFCQVNYGVTFPMFAKVDVNGKDAHPLFTWLKGEKKGLLGGKIKWNFTKFLVGRDGQVIERYAPTTEPEGHRRRHPRRAGRRGCMSPWLLLVPIGVLAGFLAFVWQRLAVAPGWRPALGPVGRRAGAASRSPRWRWPGSTSGAAGSRRRRCARPCGSGRRSSRPASTSSSGWCRCGWSASASGWCGGGHDHGRAGRRRLNRVASPLVAAVAVGVTAYGAVEAANPSVTRFEVASPAAAAAVRRGAGRARHRPARRCGAQRRRSPGRSSTSSTPSTPTSSSSPATSSTAPPRATPPRSPRWPTSRRRSGSTRPPATTRCSATPPTGSRPSRTSASPCCRTPRCRCERDGATITLAGVHDLTGEGRVGAGLRRRARRHGCRRLHAVRRAPAAPGARRRGAWRRPAAVRPHPRRADVADQLPRAAAAADARGEGDGRRTRPWSPRAAPAPGARRSGSPPRPEVPIITLRRS